MNLFFLLIIQIGFFFTNNLINNIKNKKNKLIRYNFSYKLLYKKKISLLRKKYFINYIMNNYFNRKKYNFNILKKKLKMKNSYFKNINHKNVEKQLFILYKKFVLTNLKKMKLFKYIKKKKK